MGILDTLFGSSSGQTTEAVKNTTATKNLSQATTGTVKNTGVTSTSTLDPATLASLQGIIKNLAPQATGTSPDAEAIRALIPQLVGNSDPAAVARKTEANAAEITRRFNLGEKANIAQVQQQIGSRGNSASRLLDQQGGIDLSVALANSAAENDQAARVLNAQDITAAITGLNTAANAGAAPLTQVLSAIQVLSGAQSKTETNQTQIQDLLTKIFGTETESVAGQDHTSSTSNKGVLGSILSLFGG